MARNWGGQTQFGANSRIRKLKMPIFRRRGCLWMCVYGRALFRHQWTLRKEKTDGGRIMFGGKGPCMVSMAGTTTTIEVVG